MTPFGHSSLAKNKPSAVRFRAILPLDCSFNNVAKPGVLSGIENFSLSNVRINGEPQTR